MSAQLRFIIAGLLFAALWASAAAAGKFGIQSVEPLLLFNIRFLIAGVAMLFYAHVIAKNNLPQGKQWQPLFLYGLLNTTLSLGIYIIALQQVSAGIGSLAPAVNPLLITIFSGIIINLRIRAVQWISVALGMAGIFIATYPLLLNSTATIQGLLLMLASMFCYSGGVVLYAKTDWQLPSFVINGWQVFLGGLLLLPFSVFMHNKSAINHFDARFWASEAWLIIPVSIISVQLWLYLLKIDAVRASLWLFLCPVFGFVYAAFLLNEKITLYTITGTALVIAGLYLGQRKKPAPTTISE